MDAIFGLAAILRDARKGALLRMRKIARHFISPQDEGSPL
jgi:hypothetical protein